MIGCAFKFLFKQWCREVSFCSIRKDSYYCLSRAELFGKLQGCRHVGSARDTAHETFFGCQILGGLKCLFVLYYADIVVDLLIKDNRDNSVTDSHLDVSSDRAAGQDSRVFRLYCPDLDVRILGFKDFAYACDGSAGSDAGAKAVDRTVNLV